MKEYPAYTPLDHQTAEHLLKYNHIPTVGAF